MEYYIVLKNGSNQWAFVKFHFKERKIILTAFLSGPWTESESGDGWAVCTLQDKLMCPGILSRFWETGFSQTQICSMRVYSCCLHCTNNGSVTSQVFYFLIQRNHPTFNTRPWDRHQGDMHRHAFYNFCENQKYTCNQKMANEPLLSKEGKD